MEDREAEQRRRQQSWFHTPFILRRQRNGSFAAIITRKRKRFKSLKVTLRNNAYKKRRDNAWWSINETWDEALKAEPWQIRGGKWFLKKDEPFP